MDEFEAEMNLRLTPVTQDVQNIVEQMDALKTRADKAQMKRSDFKQAMKVLTNEILAAIVEIKGENSKMVSTIKTQSEKVTEQQNELDRLREESAGHTTNGKELQITIDQLQRSISSKDEELAKLYEERSELKIQQGTNQETLETLNRRILELTARISELEQESKNNKAELDLSKQSQKVLAQLQNKLEKNFASTIKKIQDSYEKLRQSVAKLLDDVEDDSEQEANLRTILAALKGNEQISIQQALQEPLSSPASTISERPERKTNIGMGMSGPTIPSKLSSQVNQPVSVDVEPLVSPAPEAVVEKGMSEFVKELDKKMIKYFNLQSDGTYTIKDGMAIPLGNDRMTVSKEIFNKLKNPSEMNEDLKNKVSAYRKYSGISPPRPTAGGTRRKRKGRNLKGKSRKTKKRRSSSTRRKRRSRGNKGKRRSRK